MRKNTTILGLDEVREQEAMYIIGGVDKEVQNVLYLLGYALGVVCKFVSKLITKVF